MIQVSPILRRNSVMRARRACRLRLLGDACSVSPGFASILAHAIDVKPTRCSGVAPFARIFRDSTGRLYCASAQRFATSDNSSLNRLKHEASQWSHFRPSCWIHSPAYTQGLLLSCTWRKRTISAMRALLTRVRLPFERTLRDMATGALAARAIHNSHRRLSSSERENTVSHVTIKYGCRMSTTEGKRVPTSLCLDPPMHADLKQLSAATRVPIAVYLREAVSDLLPKYRAEVRRRGKP